MLALGIWLFSVGLCDLLRAARDATTRLRRLLVLAVGLLALVLLAVPAGLDGRDWLGLGLGWAVSLMAWVIGSSAALTPGEGAPTSARALAFGGLALGAVVSVLAGGVLAEPDWPGIVRDSVLTRWAVVDVVTLSGVLLAQLSTANLAVRLLLDAVGVPASSGEKQLKGGRVLGPMERIFLVGLGLAGQLTAATIVVAAKGLLRFPELQRGENLAGPSDVTEYFLIGSFASWLLALGGLAVLAVG